MKIAMILGLLSALISVPAFAQDTAWDDIRGQLFGERPTRAADDFIIVKSPYRTDNDARTVMGASLSAPIGLLLSKVYLVLDENPMPVSAVFTFDVPQPQFDFDTTFRVNGPTPYHVVAEMSDGQLFVADGSIKTSGQGACSAPPGKDPELALATLGDMTIEIGGATPDIRQRLSGQQSATKQLNLSIDHPSHSGMQMDQVTLLFVPLRFVDDVQINLDGAGFVDVTGSISLSENPKLTMSIPSHTRMIDVTMTDTDGTVSHASRALADY